jgi:hypothetical protein
VPEAPGGDAERREDWNAADHPPLRSPSEERILAQARGETRAPAEAAPGAEPGIPEESGVIPRGTIVAVLGIAIPFRCSSLSRCPNFVTRTIEP